MTFDPKTATPEQLVEALVELLREPCDAMDRMNARAALAVLRPIARDAELWRALVCCERIRIIGTGRLGEPDALIGLEAWGRFPDADPNDVAAARRTLTAFAEGLRRAPHGATAGGNTS